MSPIVRHFRRFVAVGLTALLLAPAAAFAGWMGFRNDTGQPVLLQETLGSGRLGRQQKIYANETVRDTPPAAGANRKFTIYDAAKPDRVLATGSFPAPGSNENLLYVIKKDAKGTISIEPVQTPAVKK
jgi:hypothetical protein